MNFNEMFGTSRLSEKQAVRWCDSACETESRNFFQYTPNFDSGFLFNDTKLCVTWRCVGLEILNDL